MQGKALTKLLYTQFYSPMKQLIAIIFLAVALPFKGMAGNENYPLGARSAALGGASVCLTDVWSVYNNQAGLGYIKKYTVAAYFDSKFLVSGLNTGAFAAALPLKKVGTFGLSFAQTGNKYLSENKFGLGYGRTFGENFAFGIQLNYMGIRIGEGYNVRRGYITGELGLQAKVIKNLWLGFHVFNPMLVRMADFNNERIPVIFRLGLLYKFSEKIFVSPEVMKDIEHKAVVKVGIEYAPIKQVFIRTGIATNPFQNAFGFGFNLNGLKIDVSSTIHPQLGVSPQIGLLYRFGKED